MNGEYNMKQFKVEKLVIDLNAQESVNAWQVSANQDVLGVFGSRKEALEFIHHQTSPKSII